jgi:hypothetical protein
MPTCCLISPPGAGKTTMCALTAPPPVHFLDVDRKVGTMASIVDRLVDGRVTHWPLAETQTEGGLAERVKELAIRGNKQVPKTPQGWVRFAAMVDRLEKDEMSKRASTWVVDSATHLVPHLMNLILHYSGATAGMSPREWGYFLRMWSETITALRDAAIAQGKNLIVTVHEQVSDVPLPGTRVLHEKNSEGRVERVFMGQMGMKIIPSIQGQFGSLMGSYFEEVYALRVDMVDGHPKWICRVKPDGLRDLRTSFAVAREEFDPDFRKIWR